MPRRTRIAEGVYSDAWGLAATVKVGAIQREQRFAADTSLDFLQAWRSRIRSELLEDRDDAAKVDGPVPLRGTLAGDLPRYLAKIDTRPSYKADRSHLRAWLPALGPKLRSQIRPTQVRDIMDGWIKARVAAKTIRHRLRVLRELYQRLDGAHAKPPLKGIKAPKAVAPAPVPTPMATIRKVARSLKKGKDRPQGGGIDSDKGYARFLVRATTGQRPSQIMRAEQGDVDLRRKIWFVRPGKGGNQIPLPLDKPMIEAWKAFMAADAWGAFDYSSFSRLARRHGWPKGMRPNNLRHTFAIDLLLDGADLGDVQGFLGHKQIETTRKHYAPILLARLRKVGRRRRPRRVE